MLLDCRRSPENPCPVHHIVADFRKDILGKFERQTIREIH